MCRFCTFNVNGCNNGCGSWLSNLFNNGCNSCSTNSRCGCGQSTWNRCGCGQSTWNRCGCGQSTNSRFGGNCGCVTICGNLSALFGANGESAYYSRLYGLNTTSGSGCGCGSGYNFEQTD